MTGVRELVRHAALSAFVLCIAAGGAGGTARAMDAPLEEPTPELLLRFQGGAVFPQLFNELETSYLVSVGAAYVPPLLDRRLAVVLDLAFTQPGRQGLISDPRIGRGTFRYEFTQDDYSLFLGGHFHFGSWSQLVLPYVGLGLRLHVFASKVEAESGDQALGRHRETSLQVGGSLRGGLGVSAGPGRAFLELDAGLAAIDHVTSGDDNAGSISATVGYSVEL